MKILSFFYILLVVFCSLTKPFMTFTVWKCPAVLPAPEAAMFIYSVYNTFNQIVSSSFQSFPNACLVFPFYIYFLAKLFTFMLLVGANKSRKRARLEECNWFWRKWRR